MQRNFEIDDSYGQPANQALLRPTPFARPLTVSIPSLFPISLASSVPVVSQASQFPSLSTIFSRPIRLRTATLLNSTTGYSRPFNALSQDAYSGALNHLPSLPSRLKSSYNICQRAKETTPFSTRTFKNPIDPRSDPVVFCFPSWKRH